MLSVVIMGLLALLTSAYGNVVVYTEAIPHLIMEEFRDMPASFGGDLPLEGMRGYLVQGVPPDGCSALEKPPAVDNSTDKWIVLVARYNCSFEIKIRNAQAAGYDCAIVHNVNSSDLETMSAKNPEGIDIPSVFVNEIAGQILSAEYLYTSGYYIMVNGDLPFNINTHLLLPFAIVVVLCLLVILIFMIVKCIKDRRRARRHRLPHRALLKIPTCKFSKGDPYDTCAICLDDYQQGDKLRVLPCAHAYHAVCIDPWLTQNKRVCPVCKRRVLAAGERRRRDSDSDSNSNSDDTSPLLQPTATQGGTFEEQSENPFQRAARFMARLRARTLHATHHDETPSSSPQESDGTNNIDEENGNTSENAPLLPPAVSAVSERRAPRLSRTPRPTRTHRDARAPRTRRTRSAGIPASPPAAPAPAPDTHSINGAAPHNGEIGVAALPATPSPRHLIL